MTITNRTNEIIFRDLALFSGVKLDLDNLVKALNEARQ